MVITWYGLSCIKIETQETVLVFNPFEKNAAQGVDRSPRFRAEIACISRLDDTLYNAVSGLEGTPFCISSPGEYELRGITIQGIPQLLGKDRPYTIFVARAEGMKIAHLGPWNGAKLSEEAIAACGDEIDVLCLPIGGQEVADSAEAAAMATQLEPKVVIPVMYPAASAEKESGPLAKLAKAMNSKVEHQERLSLRKKDIASERISVVALQSQLAK